jgi:hypothetical protein
MSSLVRRPAVESLGGRAVEDIDGHHHRLSPEDSRHFPLLEEGPSHPHNRLVAPLDDAVLLRVVRRGVVALNTLIRIVRREFSRCEFAVVVGAQHAQLAAAFHLRSALRAPDGVRSLSLAAKDHNPHVAGEIVDEQQEVTSSSRCSRYHRATQVPMYFLVTIKSPEARHGWMLTVMFLNLLDCIVIRFSVVVIFAFGLCLELVSLITCFIRAQFLTSHMTHGLMVI